MKNDTLYTVQEAAERLGVGETAVRNATNEGRLPFVNKYGRKLIEADALEAYRMRSQPEGAKRTGRPPKAAAATAGKEIQTAK